MWLTVFLAVVFFASVIFCGSKGSLWDNLLIWINSIFAGLLATNYFEPLAEMLKSSVSKDLDWYWDMVAFWGIFAISMLLLRAITDGVSTVSVKFRKPIEVGGSMLFAALVGWQMVMYAAFALHLSPLPTSEAFQSKPDSRNFFGLGPDHLWMSFAHASSDPSGSGVLGADEQFDADGEYVLKYGLRRFKFEHFSGGKGLPAEY